MAAIVLDTNILIDHVHGHARWLDELLERKTRELIVPTIVVAEYHAAQELETSEGKESSERYLGTFRIFDFTSPVAEVLGTLLRRKTYTPGASMVDLIIAATALFLQAPLATRNEIHFTGISGLRFFDPKQIPFGNGGR